MFLRGLGKPLMAAGSMAVASTLMKPESSYCQLDPRAESQAAAAAAAKSLDSLMKKLRNRIGVGPFVDHTLLRADATPSDVRKLCQEAVEHGFASVCVNGGMVKVAYEYLGPNSPVKVCSVVGFPLGQETTSSKVFEAQTALGNGATEIDMVINVGHLKSKDYDYVLRDIAGVVQVCKEKNATCKVIIETCLLSEEEKEAVCLLSRLAGADFVKTSTGFSTGGATVSDVELMAKSNLQKIPQLHPLPKVQVKASGGIRSLEDAMAMLEAGAARLGTSRAASFNSAKGTGSEGGSY